ncbi:MAG TPA: glycosyltransferase 87 family protein [Stellaceae bacterium]
MSPARSLGLTVCGLLLPVLTGLGLYQQQREDTAAFVAIALVQGAVFAVAAALVWRGSGSRRVLVPILAVAAAMRLTLLFAPPYLSTDIFRYVWDGRVLAAGINPYRYIPIDPHLEDLRDAEIFPNINRNNYAPTIYPPAAQAIFFAATRFGESVTVMKAAMLVFEAAAVGLLLQMLIAAGQPPVRILVYAWHPLPAWEFAGSGHIDAALLFFVVLALWANRRLPGWAAGLALAGAVLTKLYPLVLFPAVWPRWNWRMPLAFCLAIVLAYLPFLGVGWGVLGFLPGHMAEEGFSGGGAGFYLWGVARSLLPLAGAPVLVYVAGAALLLLSLGLFVAFRPSDTASQRRAAALLAGAFVLLLSPHYPWYFAWLVVFACLIPCASLLWLTLASFLLYLVPVGAQLVADRHRLIVESIIYVPFMVVAAIELWRQRRREPVRDAEHAPR